MDKRMKRRILAFYDADSTYTERLARYLGRRNDCIFEVRGFSNQEALNEFVQQTPVDVLLISKQALTKELDGRSDMVFILADNPEEKDETHSTIYKYRSSETLMREVMAAYEARKVQSIGGESRDLKAEVIGIYSPVGRCYKTTFSLILGMILSERASTLYLNFEDYPGFHLLSPRSSSLTDEDKDNLSDILYYRRVSGDEEPGRLFRTVQFAEKMAYLPPVSCPTDIRMAKMEELTSVVTSLGSSELYQYLVVDIGNAVADPLPLLALCSRIYLPGRKDQISEAKISEFTGHLASIGQEEILTRMTKLSLPTYTRMTEGITDLRSLRASPMGRYVERHLESEV